MAYGETYEEFVEKFKPKRTTDDCYTPPLVYEAVKDWAVREYGLEGARIVRPFWPGADYENEDYSGNCVVIDNPPFSILAEIKKFWLYNKSWGKEQKSGQSKPNQVKWKCKNPQPEEGILCPRKIIAQNS